MRSDLARAALCALTVFQAATASGQGSLLAVAGRTSANQSIAARGPLVVVAWTASEGSTTDVFAAVSRDAGMHFGLPVRVNAVPGEARASGEQPPRVAIVPRGVSSELVVVWTAKGNEGTRLLSARSRDVGATFSSSVVVPGGEGAGNRGWESMAVDEQGTVHVLWLDHREAAMPATMHHEDGVPMKADPVVKAGLSQLYATRLDGTGARSVARGVCYCCKTALVASHGALYAAWRHVFAGNQRDIGFAISRDRGTNFGAPVRVSDDHWAFDGCPENGPALVVDAARRAHVFWATPADGNSGTPLSLFHAMTRDGVAFTARTALPTKGAAGHVQAIETRDGRLMSAWDEIDRGKRRIVLADARVEDGRARFIRRDVDTGGEAWRPAVAASPRGVVLAWAADDGIHVRLLATGAGVLP